MSYNLWQLGYIRPMKSVKALLATVLLAGIVAVPLLTRAADDKKDKKPYAADHLRRVR